MKKLPATILHSLIPTNQQWRTLLLQKWPTIIGELGAHVRIETIQNDCIILGVYDSSWLQELYCLSPVLLQTINTQLDKPYIKRLRFKQVCRTALKEKPIHFIKRQKITNVVTLTKKEKESLQRITDPQLQKALYDFLVRCHREKRNNEADQNTQGLGK